MIFFRSLFMILVSVSFLIACGGGGGGGSTVPASPTSLAYTGSTAKAVISQSNATEITSEALTGGISANVFTEFASISAGSEVTDANRLNLSETAIALQNAVDNLWTVSQSSIEAAKAVQTEQETINGACGGTATGFLQVDDVTGDFSGDLTFANYCDADVTLNGKTDFSGIINLSTDQIENINFSFGYLTSTEPSGSSVIDGNLLIINQSNGFTLSMDMYLQDGSDVYWINNYNIEAIEYPSSVSITVSGIFYDPNYGYVTLSTSENLIVYDNDRLPTSGILLVEGENGVSGGPTRAKLTCKSFGLFNVEADTDGDGIYEWDSGDLSWDDY
jgi:hypothetical protein